MEPKSTNAEPVANPITPGETQKLPQTPDHAVAPDAKTGLGTQPWQPPDEAAAPSYATDFPSTIGKYHILSVLGEGGMGKVFLAQDPDLIHHVVIKTIRAGAFASNREREYFQREAVTLARVNHPNIVQVHYADLQSEPPFIVMEYMRHGSLNHQLKHFASAPREAVTLMTKITRAVDHIHETGILHRDLKPANILLDDENEPKVTDFGLAKFIGMHADATKTVGQFGTPSYMAPEQTDLVEGKIARATDVWALGVMLYEILTGQLPFVADKYPDQESSRKSLYRKICHDRPRYPRAVTPQLDKNLEAVVLKCLEKDVHQRFQTADDLADELQRWLDGKPLRTRPEGLLKRSWRAVKRHAILVSALVLVLFTALVILFAIYYTHPDRPLWSIENRLAAGQPVKLIGATGGPQWHEWRCKVGRASLVKKDKSFKLASWERALAALVRDTHSEEFSLHAQIKQLTSDPAGRVGLFFWFSEQTVNGQQVYSYYELTFNDVVRESQNAPKRPNAVVLRPQRVIELPAGKTISAAFSGYGRRLIKDIGFLNRPWHDVSLFVTGDQASVVFDSHVLGPISLAEARRQIHEKNLRDGTPMPPGFGKTGPVGLIAYRASVLYRNVTLEPSVPSHEKKENVHGQGQIAN